jgi:hypothetical protein
MAALLRRDAPVATVFSRPCRESAQIGRSPYLAAVLVAGGVTALVTYLIFGTVRRPADTPGGSASQSPGDIWRMPPLAELAPRRLTTLNRVWLFVLRAYLIVAAGLVLVRIVQLATGGA